MKSKHIIITIGIINIVSGIVSYILHKYISYTHNPTNKKKLIHIFFTSLVHSCGQFLVHDYGQQDNTYDIWY